MVQEDEVTPGRIERARAQFVEDREFEQSSPLYARLAPRIAADAELLRLAAHARPGQPIPVFFFGAVHYLLLQEPRHPLATYYPDLNPPPPTPLDDPFPAFRAFCRDHWTAIRDLLQTRRVQTNEVRRCACLVPVFETVARRGGRRPLALVEIGASAGLNLLWDHYHYDYGPGREVGDPASPVYLQCELRGARLPPIPATLPPVASRVGIDLNPVDLRDTDTAFWLRALIWPEHAERVRYFWAALPLALEYPPPLLAGDALDLLPQVLAALPPDVTPCIWHSYTLNQFSREARDRFADIHATFGARRDLYVIGMELIWSDQPQVRLTAYEQGTASETVLAHCSAHGRWLEWLA